MKARLYLLFLLLFSLTWSFSDAQVRRVIQNPPAKTTEKPVKEEFDENEEESTGLDDENDEEDGWYERHGRHAQDAVLILGCFWALLANTSVLS